jgi:hypothetical protein
MMIINKAEIEPAWDDFSREVCGDVKLVRRVWMTEDVVEQRLEAVHLRETTLQSLTIRQLDQDTNNVGFVQLWKEMYTYNLCQRRQKLYKRTKTVVLVFSVPKQIVLFSEIKKQKQKRVFSLLFI